VVLLEDAHSTDDDRSNDNSYNDNSYNENNSDGPWLSEVKNAAMRSVREKPGKLWWVTIIVLAAVIVAGLFAWIYQLKHGLGSAGYNDQAFWAVYIADVIAFIGVSYGGAVISAILRLTGQSWRAPLTRLAEAMALVTVVIGGAFIFPHLGRPDRILNIVVYPNFSSPLFWDFMAILTYMIATTIFFYLPLIPDLAFISRLFGDKKSSWQKFLYSTLSFNWLGNKRQKEILHRGLTIIALLIIPLAVSVHSVLSWAFALTSRPGWLETVFPPYFVIAALYSGTAMVVLVVAGFRRGYKLQRFITDRHFARLGYIMVALGLVYLYLTFADLVSEGYTGITTGWISETISGRYAIPFWFYVFAGELLPIFIVAFKRTRNAKWITIASFFVVIALWVKRLVIVLPPATQPLISGPWGSYHFTWVSITVTLAGVAAIPFLLMVMFRFIPLFSIEDMEEAGELGSVEQVSNHTLALSRLLKKATASSSNGKNPITVQAINTTEELVQ
jgi:molybdopterin-containing oxidoreductase family membrane subunit